MSPSPANALCENANAMTVGINIFNISLSPFIGIAAPFEFRKCGQGEFAARVLGRHGAGTLAPLGGPWLWFSGSFPHGFATVSPQFPNHRIYRAAYAHTAVITGAADAMVDAYNHIWDLAPSQVLIEEAGGTYRVGRDFETSDGRLLSAVFGKRGTVARRERPWCGRRVSES